MNSNLRWIVMSCLLGLLTAYVIWGNPPAPKQAPVEEQPAPKVVVATTPTVPAGTAIVPPIPSGPEPLTPERIADDAMHGLTELHFEPDSLNFGSVNVGETKVKSILVRNPTDKPINVKDLHPSCHCIEVKMADTVILPGQAQPIEVSFKGLPNRRDSTVSGFFKTDEKGTPDVVFKVHAHVQQEVVIDPPYVQFDRVNQERTQDQGRHRAQFGRQAVRDQERHRRTV